MKDGICQSNLNDFDMMVRQVFFFKKKSRDTRSRPALRPTIQKVVLALSDQQLVTSSTLLIIGYSQRCSISEYHFEIITDLAWLTFSTFSGSLLVTTDYYEENMKMRHWRALWFTIVYILIVLAQLVTYHDDWLFYPGLPVQCTLSNLGSGIGSFWGFFLSLSLILLTWSYCSLMTSFYPVVFGWRNCTRRMMRAVVRKTSELHTRVNSREPSLLKTLAWWPTYLAFLASFAFSELAASQAIKLIRDVSMMIYATASIFRARFWAPDYLTEGDEKEWTVGQILPLMLLVVPLYSIFETYSGKMAPATLARNNTAKGCAHHLTEYSKTNPSTRCNASHIPNGNSQSQPPPQSSNGQGQAGTDAQTSSTTPSDPPSGGPPTPPRLPRFRFEYSEPASGDLNNATSTTAPFPPDGPVPTKKFAPAATFPLETNTYDKLWFRRFLWISFLIFSAGVAISSGFGYIL